MQRQSSIWYEKYKPTKLEDMIIPANLRNDAQKWIAAGAIPNLGLWSVAPGLGKSSLATVLVNELDCEALWINASLEKGIDTLRSKIKSFAERSSFDGKIKIVVMDECDNLTPDAQASFRAFLDESSKNCRFIFTGNYKTKLIEPLIDRLVNIEFAEFNVGDVAQETFARCRMILDKEGIEYNPRDVATVAITLYPQMRKIITCLQLMSKDGKFVLDKELINDANSKIGEVIYSKDFEKIYTYINELSAPDTIYSYLYANFASIFEKVDELHKAQIIITLGKYQEMSASVRDKYLNACACLVEIAKVV